MKIIDLPKSTVDDSPLISVTEALIYLRVTKSQLTLMTVEHELNRHPKYRSLMSRRQVVAVAEKVAREIEDASVLAGTSVQRYRTKAILTLERPPSMRQFDRKKPSASKPKGVE